MSNSNEKTPSDALNFQEIYDKFNSNEKEFKFTFKAFNDFLRGEFKKTKLPVNKIQPLLGEVRSNCLAIGNGNFHKINHHLDKEYKKLDFISAQIKDKMREETLKSIKLKSSKAQYDEIINQHRIEKESIDNTISFLLCTLKDINTNMEQMDEKIIDTKNQNSNFVSKDYNSAIEISEEEKIINSTESQINCYYQEYNSKLNELSYCDKRINELITLKQNFIDKVNYLDDKMKDSINFINKEKMFLINSKEEAKDYIISLSLNLDKTFLNTELRFPYEFIFNKIYYQANYGGSTLVKSNFKDKCLKRPLKESGFEHSQISLKYEEEKKLK